MRFSDFEGWFAGEDCLVVAPGPSSRDAGWFASYPSYWTMGCNRAVAYCDPDLATCVEPFVDRVWPIVRASSAQVVFSHLCRDRRGKQPHPRVVEFDSKNVIPWFTPGADGDLWCAMSPFWGVAVCAYLGFATIGLIGVDLTPDRYHDVSRDNQKWRWLLKLIGDRSQVVNLSPTSRLEAVPQGGIDQVREKCREKVAV